MFRLAPALVLAGAAWTMLVVAAPLLGWPAIYAAAHLVCHQVPERSFSLAGGPIAVCARCLGLYAGAVAGGAAGMASVRRLRDARTGLEGGKVVATSDRRGRVRLLLAVAAAPTLVTIVAEWLLRWPATTNAVRFAAALPLGVAASWVVARALEVDWRT